MRVSSVRTLLDTFPHLTRSEAKLIRALAKTTTDVRWGNYGEVVGEDPLEALVERYCPQTETYVRSMHSDPYNTPIWRVTVALHAINDLLGGYGVEGLGPGRSGDYAPPFEYINMGDTYAATLIYSRDTHTLRVGSYGDIVERYRL